ncbi:L,D-transpeptidase family protein [Enterococcus saccharolyticus]|uniref:L,D-TPase catalytic domain-containing protein n=1 Tax=Candidatus Enterococcus willemsii TaxID=1857215 RepID=A0ABQ6YZZ1_9ENTE|nr:MULTISPECIES: L,D-transpeptidase family protein [Enterococcus]KAF1304181.1 hypothetical protein BAU17_04605 [Enterococcus sp. CU12B]MCD5001944.1 L,D-transpeptidase family protein [Enterococcus saccharolyticus]
MSRSNRRKQESNNGLKYIIGGLVVLLVLVAGYSYRSVFYDTHYLPKTFVEGTDISNLTVAEADKKLQDSYNSETFTLTDDKKEWKKINKTEFGLQTNFTDKLKKIQSEQNNWSWVTAYMSAKKEHSLGNSAFDEEKLAQTSEKIKTELDNLNADREPTKNATIAKGDDGFSITPEKNGTELDTAKIIDELKAAVSAGKNSLELESYKKVATVTADDENLKKELTELNNVAQVTGTYTINGESFQIPTENIMDWLIYEDGKINLDREKVYNYVSSLGDTYNTSTNSSQFNSTKRGEVTVPAGTLSWTIATDSETDALIADILAGADFTRSPISQGSTDSGSPLIGNTYVEVDLENQHMWYYKDGKVALETDIVSGKPSTLTPTGVFYIWNKERNATLRGTNDDGSKYAEPVSYWMPIDWGGVGIHDADWQPAFGGDLWKTRGSHGCVNTPPGVMATLYDSVEVGTPVIVI